MDMNDVVKAVVTLLATLISAFVIPWIKNKTTAQQRDKLLTWVQVAVAAAEQLFDEKQRKDKKEYVALFLAGKGFDVLTPEVETCIEAEVLRLHSELYGTERAG